MFAVAIDGPAGAGKSSVAKAAAQELGFVYVDTGALYRTVALYLLDHGVDPADRAAVEAELPKIEVGLKHTPEGQKMYLCGRDVTGEIRTPEVSMATSTCSAIPAVRSFLLQLQRDLAEKNNVLMDGRLPRPFHRTVIQFGKPVPAERLQIPDDSSMQLRRASRTIMGEIAALREESLKYLGSSSAQAGETERKA